MGNPPDLKEPNANGADLNASNFSITLIQATSKVLLTIGGLIFLVGDKALHDFWQVNYGVAILAGIGVGLAVMVAGAALQLALPESKRMRPRKNRGRSRV
jgi:hypothetical protein